MAKQNISWAVQISLAGWYIAPGLDDGQLHGVCGLNALAVAPHVALVGSF